VDGFCNTRRHGFGGSVKPEIPVLRLLLPRRRVPVRVTNLAQALLCWPRRPLPARYELLTVAFLRRTIPVAQ
jgi:hypothetical protein